MGWSIKSVAKGITHIGDNWGGQPKRAADGINDEASALARAEYDSWKTTWSPLETAAREYSTNKGAMSGRISAAGDAAGMAMHRASESAAIERERYGINTPENAAYQERMLGMNRAKSVAGAKNSTRVIEAARDEALGSNLALLGNAQFQKGFENLSAAGGMEAMRNATNYETARQQRAGQMGLIGGMAGGALGFAVGGPAGGMAGYQMGSGLGTAYA